jgi:peptidyl-prolyl cis-trans isomerase SurA
MKNLFVFLFFLTVICFSQELIDGIAAIVGENVILKSEVDQFTRLYASQLGIDPRYDPDGYQQLTKQSLNALIEENILLAQAKIETIEVKDRDVENTLNQQIDHIISQVGSKEEAEKMFGSPMQKIKKDYRQTIKNQLITDKLKNEKFGKVTVTRREIEDFYENFRDSIPEIPPSIDFSQILIKIKPGPIEEKTAKNKADSILTLLRNGEINFEDLAKQCSDDPATAPYGGDLGFISRGDFIKDFEEVAFALTKGQISDVVKTEFGYHIIQLIDRKGESIDVRHILIKPKISSENISYSIMLADSVHNLLINNKLSFDSAAVQFSDDPDKNNNRGKIQRIPKNQIKQPEFITVLDTLKIGEVSPVFQTNLGYHIIKLDAVYDDTWVTLEQWALEYKKSKLYEKWINKLRTKFFIDIKVDY